MVSSSFSRTVGLAALRIAALAVSVARVASAASAAGPSAGAPRDASWSRLHIGMPLYTGDDGGDSTDLTLCPTFRAFLATFGGRPAGDCKHVARGLPARVEEIRTVPKALTAQTNGSAAVKLRLDSGFAGYALVGDLQPAVPVGTILVLTPYDTAPLRLAPRQGSDSDTGLSLGKSARAKLLRVQPATSGRSLFVTIVAGKYAGKTGWIYAYDAATERGESAYSIDEKSR